MKKLNVGQVVLVSGYTKMVYIDDDRQPENYTFDANKKVFICGKRRCNLGEYCKGSSYYSFDGDCDPPSFTVTGIVWLWEVREKIDSKAFLVADDLIVEHSVEIQLEHPSLV